MKNKKYAFFTIDAESFKHTECIQKLGEIPPSNMLDGLDEYLLLLEKYDIRATLFFVLETALEIKDKVFEYIRRGHKIAVHGLNHTPPTDMSLNEFIDNTKLCKETLEKTFNQEIIGFRAPFFSLNDQQITALKQLGFKYDASKNNCALARHAGSISLKDYDKLENGIYKKDGFFEFPLVCHKFMGVQVPISGGGYIRLFPWKTMKRFIYSYLAKNNYYIFYLHPFELSKQNTPYYKKLNLYDKKYLTVGRRAFSQKIEQIILSLKKNDYVFSTMEDYALTHND